MMSKPPSTEKLRCAECDREADAEARGWHALHGREYPEDQPETYVFCPACWRKEFGGSE